MGAISVNKQAMSDGYDMTDLLTLAFTENADCLILRSGQPPVVQVRGKTHNVEGPAITPENADLLLRSLASTRYMREFPEHGAVAFIHSFKNYAQFQVQAKLEDDEIQINIQRLAT